MPGSKSHDQVRPLGRVRTGEGLFVRVNLGDRTDLLDFVIKPAKLLGDLALKLIRGRKSR